MSKRSFFQSIRKKSASTGGFTLVELVVAVAVLGLLSTITFTVFQVVNKVGASNQAAFTATGQAQTFQRNFNSNIREAREIRVTGSSQIPGGSDDTSTFGSRVDFEFNDGRTKVCKAYYVDATTGSLYSLNSTSFQRFTDATASSWLLISKVSALKSSTGSDLPYFSLSGNNLQYNLSTSAKTLRANATNVTGVTVSGGATQNFSNPNASSKCFGTQ